MSNEEWAKEIVDKWADSPCLHPTYDGIEDEDFAELATIFAKALDAKDQEILALKDRVEGLVGALESLINKVNVVTCLHRHGAEVTKTSLDNLSNRQIEVEIALKEYGTIKESKSE